MNISETIMKSKNFSSFSDLTQVQEKIETLIREKTKIKLEFLTYSSKNSEKIAKIRESIKKIDSQLEKIEPNSQKFLNHAKSQKILNIESFKIILKPLQESADILESSKTLISSKLESLSTEIQELETSKQEKIKELEEKVEKTQELQEKLKILSRDVENYKQNSIWDYKEVFCESAILEKLADIKSKKRENLKTLKNLDSSIQNLTIELEKVNEEHVSDYSDIMIPDLNKNHLELVQLEEFLNLQSKKYECEMILNTVKNCCFEANCLINESIFKHQVGLIESKMIELIEKNKISEGKFENEMVKLGSKLSFCESAYLGTISNGKNDSKLEEKFKKIKQKVEKSKKNAEKTKENFEKKIELLQDWLKEHRKFLVIDDSVNFPLDSKIIESFLDKMRDKIPENEFKSIRNVTSRYLEKVLERNELYQKISSHIDKNCLIVISKLENLGNIKAIKKSKELEREQIKQKQDCLYKSEKELIKSLEESKLEIESGRKKIYHDLLQKIQSKMVEEKKVSKEKHFSENPNEIEKKIKENFLMVQEENINNLRKIWKEESLLRKISEKCNKEIKEKIKPEIEKIQKTIEDKNNERNKLEEEAILIENSIDEIHKKMNMFADRKKEEMIYGLKRLVTCHGGERSNKIDKLYEIRAEKESEICLLETDFLRSQKEFSDKDLEKSLEILKLRAKEDAFKKYLANLRKEHRKSANRLSVVEIPTEAYLDDTEKCPKHMIKRSEIPTNLSKISEQEFEKSKSMLDPDQTLNSSKHLVPKHNYIKSQDFQENWSDVSSEIPFPSDPEFSLCSTATSQEKKIFEQILPLLASTVLYKKIATKALATYDPLENSINPPESCGFFLRKVKLNKQLTKLEIRQVGKPGVESNILIDSIISFAVPPVTQAIVKCRKNKEKDQEKEISLEEVQRYANEYHDMKSRGNLNFESKAFVITSKDIRNVPFGLVVKSGKIEFITQTVEDFKVWFSAINTIIKHRKDFEKLKFKIKQ